MAENIYYVGIDNCPSRLNSRLTQNILSRSKIPSQSPAKIHNNSRSTSCPKTERSRYMQSVQTLRKMSPVYQRNKKTFIQALRVRENEKQSQKIRQNIQGSKSMKSSAFEVIPMRQGVVQGQKTNRVQFKKVEQPRNNQKRIHWKTQVARQVYQSTNTDISPTPIVEINQNVNRNSDNNQTKLPLYQQQVLNNNSHYRLQPGHKYFICTRCYELLFLQEDLKLHSKQCKIPLKKPEFAQKWKTLLALLQLQEQQYPNNDLYRLVDRMSNYIQEDLTKREGYILYSEQLSHLLCLKGSINSKFLNQEDLFWLIQTIGDLLQTQALDLTQTTFWKICT